MRKRIIFFIECLTVLLIVLVSTVPCVAAESEERLIKFDKTQTEMIEISDGSTVTIELNGNFWRSEDIALYVSDGKVTVRNRFPSVGGFVTPFAIYATGNAEVIVENLIIKGYTQEKDDPYGCAIYVDGGASVSIKNCELYGYDNGIRNMGGTVVAENCFIKGYYDFLNNKYKHDYYGGEGVYGYGGTTILKNCEIVGGYNGVNAQKNAEISVSGGSITAYDNNGINAYNGSKITLDGVDLSCPQAVFSRDSQVILMNGMTDGTLHSNGGAISVLSGCFSCDPSEFVNLKNSDSVFDSEKKLYRVTYSEVCEIAGETYKSLSYALSQSDGSETIILKLLGDVSENIEIGAAMDLCIDMNGFTDTGIISVEGKLHICNGTLKNSLNIGGQAVLENINAIGCEANPSVYVSSNGSLSLCGNTQIKGNPNGSIYVSQGAELTVTDTVDDFRVSVTLESVTGLAAAVDGTYSYGKIISADGLNVVLNSLTSQIYFKKSVSPNMFVFTAPQDNVYNSNGKAAFVSAKADGIGEFDVEYYMLSGENKTYLDGLPKNVGEYFIEVRLSENDEYVGGVITDDTWSFRILPKEVNVKAVSAEKIYGEHDPEFGAVSEADVVWSLTRESGEDVGEYIISAFGDEYQGNYKVVYSDSRLKIKPKPITVTVGEFSKTYGESDPNFSAYCPIDGILYEISRENGENAGEYSVFAIGETVQGNYSVTFISGTLTVNRRNVTVKAQSREKTYGEADPEFKCTVEGLIGGDKVSYTVTRTEGEDAGIYSVYPQGEKNQGNYTVRYLPDTLTIKPSGDLSLSCEKQNTVYDGALHFVSAVANIENATIFYSCDGGQTWALDAPCINCVGELTVNVKAEAQNYLTAFGVCTLTIQPFDIKNAAVRLETEKFPYTSREIIPEITVVRDKVLLSEGEDYTAVISDNINPGNGKIRLIGCGNYCGEAEAAFEIFKYNVEVTVYGGKTYEKNQVTNPLELYVGENTYIGAENISEVEIGGETVDLSCVSAENGFIRLSFDAEILDSMVAGAVPVRVYLCGSGYEGTVIEAEILISENSETSTVSTDPENTTAFAAETSGSDKPSSAVGCKSRSDGSVLLCLLALLSAPGVIVYKNRRTNNRQNKAKRES